MFVKIKPSVMYLIFSLMLYISHFIGSERPIIRKLLGKSFNLPNKIWFHLSYSWIAFFIFLSLLNLYIAYNYETDTWVNFKIFGLFSISIIFIISQFFFITKYIRKDK